MIIKVPYRINWAGAYLDCIEKPVVTSVINKYIKVKSKSRDDNKVSVFSNEFNTIYETDLCPNLNRRFSWTDYIDGCIAVFVRNNIFIKQGCSMLIDNDLSSGLGVSSSAAFIVAVLKTICYWNNLDLSDSLIAKFGYWVEHDYLQIPCGRMDFKAVLHEHGIWKIDTSTDDLAADSRLDDKHYEGLLIYNEQHNHSADSRFMNIVSRIKNAEANTLLGQFIHFEECIVDSIAWRANEKGLNESWLGMFLNYSMINLKRNLFDEKFELNNLEGVYGDKLVGSGLKGAHFLLINKEYKEELMKELSKDYNIVEVEI